MSKEPEAENLSSSCQKKRKIFCEHYTLYNLIGRLATFVPVGTVSFRMNLLAACFTLASLFFVLRTCLNLSRRESGPPNQGVQTFELWFSLLFTATAFLFCQSVFAQSLTAKGGIYTLTLLFLSVMVWQSSRRTHTRSAYWIGFLWAVSMGNHWETGILWIPFLFLWFKRIGVWWSPKRIMMSAAFCVLGISPYLYLPLRAQLGPAVNWENPHTFSAFLRAVLREPYSANNEWHLKNFSGFLFQIDYFLKTLTWHWMPGFVLLAGLGAWLLFKRQRAWFVPVVWSYGVVVVILVFVLDFNKLLIYYLGNFLVSTQGLLAVAGFFGTLFLLDYCRKHLGPFRFLVPVILAFGIAAWGWFVFGRQDKSRYFLAEDYGINSLKELPSKSVLFFEGDQNIMPFFYIKNILHLRHDLTVIPTFELGTEWGWKRVLRTTDTPPIPQTGVWDRFSYLTSHFKGEGRAVFYSIYDRGLQAFGPPDIKSELYPWGINNKIDGTKPTDAEVETRVWKNVSSFRLRSLQNENWHWMSTEISSSMFFRSYATPMASTGTLLLRDGDLAAALRDYQRAFSIFPAMDGIYLSLGKWFEEKGDLALAKTLYQKETDMNPTSSEAYFLLGRACLNMGLYHQAASAFQLSLNKNPNSVGAKNGLEIARGDEYTQPQVSWKPKEAVFYQEMGQSFLQQGVTFLSDAAFQTSKEIAGQAR